MKIMGALKLDNISTLIFLCGIIQIYCDSNKPDADIKEEEQAYSMEIHRWHTAAGFHRDLFTSIQVEVPPNNSQGKCKLMLIEKLPTGMYVDMDQLHNFAEKGGPKVLSKYHIDVEKPQYHSSKHTIYVYTETTLVTNRLNLNVIIPVHLRYHKPSLYRTEAKTVLHRPRVFVRCPGTFSSMESKWILPCDHSNTDKCPWLELKGDVKSGALLSFAVPVGNRAHFNLVTVGTAFITLIGTVSIIYTMYRYPED